MLLVTCERRSRNAGSCPQRVRVCGSIPSAFAVAFLLAPAASAYTA